VECWENCSSCRKSTGDSSAFQAVVRWLVTELADGITLGSYEYWTSEGGTYQGGNVWGVGEQPSFLKSCQIFSIYSDINRVPNFRISMGLRVYGITCIMKSEVASITLTDQGTSNCASRSSAPLVSFLIGGWSGEEQDTACNHVGKDRRGNRMTTTVQV